MRVPVLSRTSVFDLSHHFDRLGVLEQDAQRSPSAHGHHDEHGVASPKSARARDDEHGDGIDDGVRHARRRSGESQTTNVTMAAPMTGTRSPPRRRQSSGWARLAAPPETMATIRARSVSAPTFSARMTSPPVPFTVAPTTRVPSTFSTGIASPLTISSSTELAPSSTTPSTGNLYAGPNADDRLPERYRGARLSSVPSPPDAPRGLGSEAEQLLDGRASLAARGARAPDRAGPG